jgi:hypothetical protein
MSDIGDFFKEIFTDVVGDKEVKTTAITTAVRAMTGSNPIVDRSNPNVNVIQFTKKQKEALNRYFDKKTSTKTSSGQVTASNVKIDHKPLWMPWVIKKATPYAIGAVLIGFVAGRYIK